MEVLKTGRGLRAVSFARRLMTFQTQLEDLQKLPSHTRTRMRQLTVISFNFSILNFLHILLTAEANSSLSKEILVADALS